MSTYLGSKSISFGAYVTTDKVVLSTAEFEALEVKDENTLYILHDDPSIEDINAHVGDVDIHVTAEEKDRWNNVDLSAIDKHVANGDVHVTAEEKQKWNNVDFSAIEAQVQTAQTTANEAKTVATNAQTTANSKAPMYTYGTADLTAGSSPLATGTLYFVYE